jgi:ribosomal protein S27E
MIMSWSLYSILLRGIQFTQVKHYSCSNLQMAFSSNSFTVHEANTCAALVKSLEYGSKTMIECVEYILVSWANVNWHQRGRSLSSVKLSRCGLGRVNDKFRLSLGHPLNGICGSVAEPEPHQFFPPRSYQNDTTPHRCSYRDAASKESTTFHGPF